jgi:hypothetical protein
MSFAIPLNIKKTVEADNIEEWASSSISRSMDMLNDEENFKPLKKGRKESVPGLIYTKLRNLTDRKARKKTNLKNFAARGLIFAGIGIILGLLVFSGRYLYNSVVKFCSNYCRITQNQLPHPLYLHQTGFSLL